MEEEDCSVQIWRKSRDKNSITTTFCFDHDDDEEEEDEDGDDDELFDCIYNQSLHSLLSKSLSFMGL